jgi:hypothetical protein
MIIKNKLDKIFGPVGSSAGFFLIVAGAATTYFSFLGLVFVVLGAFTAFTSTSSIIDTGKKRIKFSNNIFGLISLGKWIEITPGMKLLLKKTRMGLRSYSISTTPLDYQTNDIRIMLMDPDNKQIMPVKKFISQDTARTELEELKVSMGLNQNG